ncbi:MAG: hypothetical protein U0Y68_15070 [Blastocatellia bacterium]
MTPFGFNRPTLTASMLDARGGIVGLQTGVGGVDESEDTQDGTNYLIGVQA